MLEAPPGTRTLKYARCSATAVPAENLEPWADIPEQFQNQTTVCPERRDSNGVFKQIPGGVKKDTCGAEQTARLLLLEILQRAKVPVSLPAAALCL